MEVFCRNVPDHVTEKLLHKNLAPSLKELSIFTYQCRKLRKGCATLTIGEASKGQKLLDRYGDPRPGTRRKEKALTLFGRSIYMSLSKNSPDDLLIRSLQEEEVVRKQKVPKVPISEPKKLRKTFAVNSLSCGVWDYAGSNPVFVRYFHAARGGTMHFGKTLLTISLQSMTWPYALHEFKYDYVSISDPIYLGSSASPTVTLSMEIAPRLYMTLIDTIDEMMGQLSMNTTNNNLPSRRLRKTRIDSLGKGFDAVAATCFTYQVTLANSADLRLLHPLKEDRRIPEMISWVTRTIQPRSSLEEDLGLFMSSLDKTSLPYCVAYQLQMLVWNGVLPPRKVVKLFPCVQELLERAGAHQSVRIIQLLARDVQYAGPEADETDFAVETLIKSMAEIEARIEHNGYIRNNQSLHPNRTYVHKATVTPLGTYLYGPYWENKNRVLRRYDDFTDYFMRVEFSEENGDPIMFDQTASLDQIYGTRFRNAMLNGFVVGGREFEFLGFSHSSLRSQSCWFMAAFKTASGEMVDARNIIDKLGDFGEIRVPAKCAARIGQAFSDTLTSIEISPKIVKPLDDVERYGHVFSDGVGTLSYALLHKIGQEYAVRAKLKPTVFQIRVAGAKGMISLDSTLMDNVLCLRPSMVKFNGVDSWKIEICGSGIKPLPMYLNRQLIKILEDLGVPAHHLLSIQQEEVDSLRKISQSPVLAANFLEKSNLAPSTRMPFLIRALVRLKLKFLNDRFLRRMIELAVIVKLRELKYRSRILVNRGLTLYGIMDETGFLREGEVYCPYLSENGQRQVLIGNRLVITRAPALHPGDVQLVNAVDVPTNSPLNDLHNCIVFSQKGERDLPSKLSGGDLDGDLYNIIYDERLCHNAQGRPLQVAVPADYPRLQAPALNRKVQREDIINHFLVFMQQDQLGRIANLHQIIADSKGTFNADCLTLAELHSTAVDFSKTGIPADISRLPKHPRIRPDFMAPGPRVKIEDKIELIKSIVNSPEPDDEDVDEAPQTRYYMSRQVIGQLYRSIDETAFIEELRDAAEVNSDGSTPDIFKSLWIHVQRETTGFQWAHHIIAATESKEIYEECLTNLMYQYSSNPWATHLDELEIFVGNIIGTKHNLSKRQREASSSMREDYSNMVEYVVGQIQNKDGKREESLERSIACMSLGLLEDQDDHGAVGGKGKIKLLSFRWIAAAICLLEIDRMHKSR